MKTKHKFTTPLDREIHRLEMALGIRSTERGGRKRPNAERLAGIREDADKLEAEMERRGVLTPDDAKDMFGYTSQIRRIQYYARRWAADEVRLDPCGNRMAPTDPDWNDWKPGDNDKAFSAAAGS